MNADLSADVDSESYETLLRVWQRAMATADVSPGGLDRMKAAYSKNVAILSPSSVAFIIEEGDFKTATHFFQAVLIHAWFAKRV